MIKTAERRMFAKTIIDSDAFLDMPLSAQALYFQLSMRADDDGFVNNPKRIQRMIGASEDDLKLLIAKSFVLIFDTGVIVIKHWRINNYLRGDRYKPTVYQDEYQMIAVKENGAYTLSDSLGIPNGYQMDTNGIPNGYQMDTQYRLGKESIGKDSKEEKKGRFAPPSLEELSEYIHEKGYAVDPEAFIDFYTSKGWKIGKETMKDWKAAVRTWARRDNHTVQKKPEQPQTGGMAKGNKFQEYDQRTDYDFEALEKMLTAN